jgi:hypothetical protein
MASCNLCGVEMVGGCAANGCPHRATQPSVPPPNAVTDAETRVARAIQHDDDGDVYRAQVGDIRALLALLATLRKDQARLDWLERMVWVDDVSLEHWSAQTHRKKNGELYTDPARFVINDLYDLEKTPRDTLREAIDAYRAALTPPEP